MNRIFNKEIILILIILILGFLTRFYFFGWPAEVVFDEVHLGKYINGYLTQQYFFDLHPPLGKLLIAGVAYLGKIQPNFDFEKIGQPFNSSTLRLLRFLPSLAGALLPLIIYLFVKEFLKSKKATFLAALFIVFDNAILVQSRFILTDIFILLFGFLGLWLISSTNYESFTNIRITNRRFILLFLGGLSLGAAFSVKWTGLSFLAIALFILFIDFLEKRFNFNFKSICIYFLCLIVVPILFYFSVFAVHLKILSHSGSGDAFMGPSFQKTLINSQYQNSSDFKELNLWQKFIELNQKMYQSSISLKTKHSYASTWKEWPLMLRPIYYWVGQTNNQTARIYFLGNPLLWWLGYLSLAISFLFIIYSFLEKWLLKMPIQKEKIYRLSVLLFAFLINWLPFIFIKRVTFLYHYLPALVFALIIFAYILAQLTKSKLGTVVLIFLMILIVGNFVFFSPLSYGLPLSEQAYQWRVWLPTWR